MKNIMQEAMSTSAKELTIEERVELTRGMIAEQTEKILAQEVRKAIATTKNKVDITLGQDECIDQDRDLEEYLQIMGFKDIDVSSDFPGYNESYRGTTTIKFSV